PLHHRQARRRRPRPRNQPRHRRRLRRRPVARADIEGRGLRRPPDEGAMSFRDLNRVVLVEDDAAFREALTERLRLAGLEITACASAEAALKVLNERFEGVVVTDLRMPGMDGRALVERLAAIDADLPVVMMTGHGDIAEAVEAMKRGAYDFLAKPFAPERLIESLRRALDKRALVLDNRR